MFYSQMKEFALVEEEKITQVKIADNLTIRVGQWWRIEGEGYACHLKAIYLASNSYRAQKVKGDYFITFEWENFKGSSSFPVDIDIMVAGIKRGTYILRRDVPYTKLDLKMMNEHESWDF